MRPLCQCLLLPLLAALALAGAGCRKASEGAITDPLALTPVLALGALHAHMLYYNAAARPWLLEKRPDLVPAEDREGAGSARVRAMAQAVQNPKLFRQLDRQNRFDALLLTGDPSQYRPLLDHLLEAQDWKLAYLDHTSLIFRRDRAAPWSSAELAPVRARLASLPRRAQALCTAQIAGKLVAVREMPLAKELLDQAEKLSSEVPQVWSTRADYRMAQGDWTGALAAADRALKLDPESLAALGAKAQSLYAKKRFSEAYTYSSRLLQRLPDDPGILFYHAKICHESRHYQEEVVRLERLIQLAEESGRIDPGYFVYLGQAYAAEGEAEPALRAFARALAEPDLPKEQRTFCEETVALIRQKTGAKSPAQTNQPKP